MGCLLRKIGRVVAARVSLRTRWAAAGVAARRIDWCLAGGWFRTGWTGWARPVQKGPGWRGLSGQTAVGMAAQRACQVVMGWAGWMADCWVRVGAASAGLGVGWAAARVAAQGVGCVWMAEDWLGADSVVGLAG